MSAQQKVKCFIWYISLKWLGGADRDHGVSMVPKLPFIFTITPSSSLNSPMSLCYRQSSNTETILLTLYLLGSIDIFLHAAYFLYIAELLALLLRLKNIYICLGEIL